jgi:AcrR family transcriptional regulator
VEAAVTLARRNGPDAVTLREATRMAGVSPNAAYRHFADVADLIAAVQLEALAELTAAMRAELSKVRQTGKPDRDAMARLRALGAGYLAFALAQPGLFAAAFVRLRTGGPVPSIDPKEADFVVVSGEPVVSPYRLLHLVISEMDQAGCLRGGDVGTATLIAWADVHGLAQLLGGALAAIPASSRNDLIDATLTATLTGLSAPAGIAAE